MRIIGLDIHRVFAEAVALEDGEYKRLRRIGMTRDHLAAFAETLSPTDHVVVEATGNATAVLDILAPSGWACDKPAFSSGKYLIQGSFRYGGHFGSEPDVGGGMGVLRAFPRCDPRRRGAPAVGPPARSGRRLLDRTNWRALAGPARRVRQMGLGLSPVPALDARRALGDDPRGPQRERSRPGQRADDGQHDRPGNHCAAGARGGFRARISAARRVASRPRPVGARQVAP